MAAGWLKKFERAVRRKHYSITNLDVDGDRLSVKQEARERLRMIGEELDVNSFPSVLDGGFVMPRRTAVPFIRGEVNDRDRERRSEAWKFQPHQQPRAPRSRNTDMEGSLRNTTRVRTPSAASSLFVSDDGQIVEQLSGVLRSYPASKLKLCEGGVWLLVKSELLAGASRAATFLIACPLATELSELGLLELVSSPKSRFGLDLDIQISQTDRSVPFDLADKTWVFGDSLVSLIDIYTVWAIRHLHLEFYGRWPGPQSVPDPYERTNELLLDEQCGCARPVGSYGECCAQQDRRRNMVDDAVRFMMNMNGGHRAPPRQVVDAASSNSLDGLEDVAFLFQLIVQVQLQSAYERMLGAVPDPKSRHQAIGMQR